MKRRIIKAILALIRTIIESVCAAGMLVLPALLVHNGHDMDLLRMLVMDIPLSIPLSICLYIDWRAEKNAEARRMLAALRRYEKEQMKNGN